MKDYSKFFGREWSDFLAPILSSEEYYKIGLQLKNQYEQGVPITPGFSNIFRAFKECPLHTLHTIIIGQDVYHTKTKDGEFVADGIAFSSNTSTIPPPSLNSIYEAIDQDIFSGEYDPPLMWDPTVNEAVCDLKRWSRQGILLINCAFTTVVGNPGAHIELWRPFTERLIAQITDHKDSLGMILMGAQAKSLRSLVKNDTHFVAMCEHPSAALHHNRRWNHYSVFSALDKFQKHKNNITIKW